MSQWQQDVNGDGSDRHAIIVQRGNGYIGETWQTKLVGGHWEASSGAKFSLTTKGLQPAG